jgi:hypothetical protein
MRFVIVNVVFGGSTRKQPAPSFCTQYHQSLDLLVPAFQASEMLVAELAVIRRFVGVVGDGGLAGVPATKTRASTTALAANTVLLTDMAPPGS